MPLGLLEYAKKKFREYYFERKATRNFSVAYRTGVYSEDVVGTVAYIMLCEHEISNDRDLTRLMTFIRLEPDDLVVFYDAKKECFRSPGDVIKDILECEAYVKAQAKVLKSIGDEAVLLRILDDTLLCVEPEIVEEVLHRAPSYVSLTGNQVRGGLIPVNPADRKGLAEALAVLL